MTPPFISYNLEPVEILVGRGTIVWEVVFWDELTSPKKPSETPIPLFHVFISMKWVSRSPFQFSTLTLIPQ